MLRVCVYCGSSSGSRSIYGDAARELADTLVRHELELVYGGADKGIMGVLANAVLERGGIVHGVIPKMLCDKELAHQNLTKLHVVASMHERKMLMAALSDGFIAMPGGYGTLEEIVEIVTWGQLKFHEKPCGLLNVDGYFDHLLAYFDRAVTEGFLRPQNRRMLMCEKTPAALIRKFEKYTAPRVEKWTS
ncbi:MAG: TIGR00730 family Rossman fold protein [Gammaproteobacteria bacterium]|nr:TIGR00730 family Rossman fold protein [Gammaproteobacteria bacterium]